MLQHKMDGSSLCLIDKGKVISSDELAGVRHGSPVATIVLCHGTWDLIHPGVIDHLRQARVIYSW